METLKPAHEVVVEQIKKHCGELATLDKWIRGGGFESGGRWVSIEELLTMRLQPIGGLSSQLDALALMVIPPDKLEGVIGQLREAETIYSHAATSHAIQKLMARKAAAA